MSDYLLSENEAQTNRYSLDEASRIYSLFDHDFLSICGESFVLTCAIGVLVYGVLSVQKDLFQRTFSKDTFLSFHPSSPGQLLFSKQTERVQDHEDTEQKDFREAGKDFGYNTTREKIQEEQSDKESRAKRRINQEPILTLLHSSGVSAPILVRNCGVHALLVLFFATLLLANNPLYGEAFYNSIVLDYFTRLMQIAICLATFFSVCISLQYIQKINTYELVVLILLAVASMLLLASASDLICMYAAIEFQSLCFYVLAGLKRNSESSTEAGLKYLLLGGFSSGILLFGCSLLYTFTGTSSFFELAHLLSNSEYNSDYSTLLENGSLSSGVESRAANGVEGQASSLEKREAESSSGAELLSGVEQHLNPSPFSQRQDLFSVFQEKETLLPLRACQLGFTFLLVGLLFKCAAAPFHMWVPDVYEGAPTPITLFFSIVPKLSVFAVLIRLLSLGTFEGCISHEQLQGYQVEQLDAIQQAGPYSVLVFSCVASLLVGTFSAISQNKMKRLLAYSSIGHVGFLLIGCTLHSGEGIVAVLVYLLIYIAMTIPIFAFMLSPLARERYLQLSGSR